MRRPTKSQLENGILLVLVAASLVYNLVTQGLGDTIFLVIGVTLLVAVLTAIQWFARKVGR